MGHSFGSGLGEEFAYPLPINSVRFLQHRQKCTPSLSLSAIATFTEALYRSKYRASMLSPLRCRTSSACEPLHQCKLRPTAILGSNNFEALQADSSAGLCSPEPFVEPQRAADVITASVSTRPVPKPEIQRIGMYFKRDRSRPLVACSWRREWGESIIWLRSHPVIEVRKTSG